MRGTVKWFNSQKGYGFITDSYGKDYFFHYLNIQMDGFKSLEEGDIVEFEVGLGTNNREQAVNINPIMTRKIAAHELSKDKLHLQIIKDAYGARKYLIADANDVLQTGEEGMTLEEVAAYIDMPVKLATIDC